MYVWYTTIMNMFSDPIKIIEQFNFSTDHTIADFGAGNGAYSLALARSHRGDFSSTIYAIDVIQDMLTKLKAVATQEGLPNIKVIWGDIEDEKGSRLRNESIDMVLIANTLFQVEDKHSVIKEALRVLKTDGRLVIIDWSESFGNIGPKEEAVLPYDRAKTIVEAHGLVFDKKIDVGEHHYGFISRKL